MKDYNNRILHIVSSISVGNGITNVVMNYFRKSFEKGIIFDFAYFYESDEDFSDEIRKMGGVLFKLPHPTIFNIINFQSLYFKEMEKYHIIHSHELALQEIIYKKIKRDDQLWISHSHSVIKSTSTLGEIRNNFLSRNIFKISTHLVSCSRKSGDFWFKKNGKVHDYSIIYNSLDYSKFIFNINDRELVRSNLGLSDDTKVLGHIGRYSVEKNHELLLLILFDLIKIDKTYHLLLVGDGPLSKTIKERIDELEIGNNVTLIKSTTSPWMYYSSMDIFLFPSKKEGFGMAAIEAQINGLYAIISTDITENELQIGSSIDLPINISTRVWSDYIHNNFQVLSNNRALNKPISSKYSTDQNINELLSMYKKKSEEL